MSDTLEDVFHDGRRGAELGVLGAVLRTHGDALDDIAVTGADFFDGRRGELFDLLRTMRAAGSAVDEITLIEELQRRGDLNRLVPGGAAGVWGLADQVPTAANVGFYADIVHEGGVRSRVREVGLSIAQQAGGHGDLQPFMDDARKRLDEAFGVSERRVRFMGDAMLTTIDELEKPAVEIGSPWRALNDVIGGFRPARLYVIGARPGVGKTAIALQCAWELARRGAVAFCSLEMTEAELHVRVMAQGAQVPVWHLTHPESASAGAVKFSWNAIAGWRAANHDRLGRLAFDDRSSMSVFDVRGFARSVARVQPLAGVVVDYLQLMTDSRDIPRHEKVAEMSRHLKVLARDLEVPVIALSQLNRSSDGRADKRPALSDLRESGAIEQDADVVILLHRETDKTVAPELSMYVAKNRQGESKLVRLTWDGARVTARDRVDVPTMDEDELDWAERRAGNG